MKQNILCVDDIQTNLFILTSVFEEFAGDQYNLFLATSAMEGLDILLKEKIDLILLDIMMPEIDGFAAAKMIRSNKKTKDIPIIFVTAKKDDESIEMCYKVGGDDYVNKPFNYTELLARVSFHIQSKEKDVLLKEEQEYVQSILNLQENMILVTDGKKAINANHALLNFYNVETVEDFQKTLKCVCFTFIKDDGFFSLNLLKEDDQWVNEVIQRSKSEDVVVKIIKDETIEAIFNVKAATFKEQYIVTLTDITQISNLSLEYQHEANFDSLTQVYNRNMFQRLISKKITMAKVEATSFVFIILDIDYFKNVNDTHGHLVGDKVLKQLSALIKKHTRINDIFARWGGEEFVLSFNVKLKKGLEIAESLRVHIENENFEDVDQITCSFGVTEFKDNDTQDSLIKRADTALYEAKERGRNMVCQA
ncbi:MAG: diguanylate cyclase [Helicobacteraceae bacterium]|nr:diguanylate cyclase [Helicobacteraceae bacterium]